MLYFCVPDIATHNSDLPAFDYSPAQSNMENQHLPDHLNLATGGGAGGGRCLTIHILKWLFSILRAAFNHVQRGKNIMLGIYLCYL